MTIINVRDKGESMGQEPEEMPLTRTVAAHVNI